MQSRIEIKSLCLEIVKSHPRLESNLKWVSCLALKCQHTFNDLQELKHTLNNNAEERATSSLINNPDGEMGFKFRSRQVDCLMSGRC